LSASSWFKKQKSWYESVTSLILGAFKKTSK
jgi:hypothetical protein